MRTRGFPEMLENVSRECDGFVANPEDDGRAQIIAMCDYVIALPSSPDSAKEDAKTVKAHLAIAGS